MGRAGSWGKQQVLDLIKSSPGTGVLNAHPVPRLPSLPQKPRVDRVSNVYPSEGSRSPDLCSQGGHVGQSDQPSCLRLGCLRFFEAKIQGPEVYLEGGSRKDFMEVGNEIREVNA